MHRHLDHRISKANEIESKFDAIEILLMSAHHKTLCKSTKYGKESEESRQPGKFWQQCGRERGYDED
jgi:hypothetical protein